MNAGTRSLAVQCQSRKSTGVQTKRLSKEELRYYTKIVDKEKQVLLKFLKATKEYPQIRQPHYRVNLFPTQTKYRKNSGTRKKRKHKHSKHSSHKTKPVPGMTKDECEGDEENSGHYVSKIVVDDATHCLKLRVRSCNPKKGSSMHELKENKNLTVLPERVRSRKAKQPRRFNRSLESLTEELENSHGGLKEVDNKSPTAKIEPRLPYQKPLSFKHNRDSTSPKEIINPEEIINDENEINTKRLPLSSTTLADKPIIKDEVENTDCLFANKKPRDDLSSPASSSPPTMTSHLTPIFPPGPSDDESSDRQATSSSSDSNYHSQDEDSDGNQSVCSEEFFIVEGNSDFPNDGKETRDIRVIEFGAEANSDDTMITEQTDVNKKDELKKRLKGNLLRKEVDNGQSDNENKTNMAENIANMAENKNTAENVPKNLPHVVSVHFYDPQTHSQRVVGADTHITQYPSYTMVQNPKTPSSTLPYPTVPPLSNRAPKSPSATMPSNILQATLPRLPPMNYPYPSYHRNATEIPNQRPAYHIPGIPSIISTKVRTLVPQIYSNSITTREVASFKASIPTKVRLNHPGLPTKSVASHGVASATSSDSTEVLRSQHHPEILTNGITAPETSISSANVPTDVAIHHPELSTNNTISRGVAPHKSNISPDSPETEQLFRKIESKKRKRFIFGSHEPPKKKVISSLLTPLCEREATRLADGIHEINMQYFPLRSLAQKAANRVSEDTDDVLKLIDQKIQLKTKIQDVEKARNLLKDIYDMVLKSKEIEDIQNFELVSHNFGVRNILNHLSLVDLYFGELGTELQSKI